MKLLLMTRVPDVIKRCSDAVARKQSLRALDSVLFGEMFRCDISPYLPWAVVFLEERGRTMILLTHGVLVSGCKRSSFTYSPMGILWDDWTTRTIDMPGSNRV